MQQTEKKKNALRSLHFVINCFLLLMWRKLEMTWKTRNIWSLLPSKDKSDYKWRVVYKGDFCCGSRYIGETKRNAEIRWNKHNNLTKVQNHWNTFEATSTTALHGLSFEVLQKMVRPGRNFKDYILLTWNLVLKNKKTLMDYFYSEMLLRIAINDIMQTRLWNATFQCTSLIRLAIIHLRESLDSKMTRAKHKCASLCNIVKEWITKTWFINETQR